MNPDELHLQYSFGDTLPPTGTTLEVAPGVRWLRMPLPFALDHINLWLLRDRDDGPRGLGDRRLRHCQRRHARRLGAGVRQRTAGLPVLRVIVTHMHPDHIGLAHWLTERWSGQPCRLWISGTDYNAARWPASRPPASVARAPQPSWPATA
jgi:glyoxylase-like metal-dependent hydrolase (beta-lactamase superfamily II)